MKTKYVVLFVLFILFLGTFLLPFEIYYHYFHETDTSHLEKNYGATSVYGFLSIAAFIVLMITGLFGNRVITIVFNSVVIGFLLFSFFVISFMRAMGGGPTHPEMGKGAQLALGVILITAVAGAIMNYEKK